MFLRSTAVTGDTTQLPLLPSPFTNAQVALLKVYDTGGRLVIAKELVCTKGHNSYALDLQKEISGMFYITLSIGDKVHHAKLLKQ